MISIWADGSSSGAGRGAGGYGWLIAEGEKVLHWGYGGTPLTTNNLMELEGCIQGLEAVLELGLNKPGVFLELVSDSQYALGMASGEWNATKNLEAVHNLRDLAAALRCRFRWVRGHEGTAHNETCDKLAKQGKIENLSEAQRVKMAAKKSEEIQVLTETRPCLRLGTCHFDRSQTLLKHHMQTKTHLSCASLTLELK